MKAKFLPAVFILSIFSQTYCFGQWQKTAGPPGITIKRFFDTDSVLFAGTSAKGVFRSADHGATWQASNTGLENEEVFSFEKDSLYIYAGTETGVYRSSDNGHTWLPANDSINDKFVNCLLIAAGNLFAGTVGGGVWRSEDHGSTWINANGGALSSSYIMAMVYSAPRLMVEADNYIFYSTDSGSTWNVDNGNTAFYVIKNFVQKGDTIIATTGSSFGGTNAFRTVDGGVNWTPAISVSFDAAVSGLVLLHDTIFCRLWRRAVFFGRLGRYLECDNHNRPAIREPHELSFCAQREQFCSGL